MLVRACDLDEDGRVVTLEWWLDSAASQGPPPNGFLPFRLKIVPYNLTTTYEIGGVRRRCAS